MCEFPEYPYDLVQALFRCLKDIPAIAQMREGVKQEGLLGDCKTAAFGMRAFTQAGGGFYLCPLPAVQLPDTFNPVCTGEQSLGLIYRQEGDGIAGQIAEGYERTEQLSPAVDEKTIK